MKKTAFVAVLMCTVAGMASAQLNLGARLNAGWGLGSELSAHYRLSKLNRVEADLGINWWKSGHYNHTYTAATATYQWTFPIPKASGFSWYVGPGGQLGIHHEAYRHGNESSNDTYLRLVAVGQVGLEYNFDFPLQLTIDIRPGIDLIHFSDPFVYSLAAGARYRF